MVTVAAGTPTRQGYYFAGWNPNANGTGTTYLAGDTFVMPSNMVILNAIFLDYQPHYIFYDNNRSTGGAAPVASGYQTGSTVTVGFGGTLVAPANSFFAGWNTKPDGSG